MSFNLINLVKSQINDQVNGQLATVIEADASQNDAAINSAIPGIFNALNNLSASNKDAASLFKVINDQDDRILNNLSGVLGNSNMHGKVMSSGIKALSGLLKREGLDSLITVVSDFSGVKKRNAGLLAGLLAPIIFSVIKRKSIDSDGSSLDVTGLMKMLNSQQPNVVAAMPPGFSDALKLNGFHKIGLGLTDKANPNANKATATAKNTATASNTNTAKKVTATANKVNVTADNAGDNTAKVTNKNKSLIMIALASIVLIGTGLLAYNVFFKGETTESTKATISENTPKSTNGAISGNTTPTSNPSKVETINDNKVANELSNTLDTLTSSLSGITDVNSAKTALPNLTSSLDQMGNIAEMMKKLPEADRGPVKKVISDGLPQIQQLINKLSAIPGVAIVLKPVVVSMSGKLGKFN